MPINGVELSMKKSTKKTIMALSIIVIFGMSSAAFVASSFGGNLDQQSELKPLDRYVVDGPIDIRLENTYIQGGVTFLKIYKNDQIENSVIYFADQAPETFLTPSGQVQLIVLKINSTENYASIVNINGETRIDDISQDSIFDALCTYLLAPPTECAIRSLNLSS